MIDPAIVERFIADLHGAAGAACAGVDQPGLLQLVQLSPRDGKLTIGGRFRIGDVERMVAAAISAAENGLNVFVEPRTIGEHVRGWNRGSDADSRAVFALVVDRDGDKGRAGVSIGEPSLTVETSPGNAHEWFLFERAITADRAAAIGAALRAATGADAATGKPSQPYRVPGLPNYPDARKIERGRTACATAFRNGGPVWDAGALERLVSAAAPIMAAAATASAFDEAATGLCDALVESLVAEPATADMDRSAQFHRATCEAVERGMTAADLESLMREHPEGCAQKYIEPRDRLREEIARVWEPRAAELEEERQQSERGAEIARRLMEAVRRKSAQPTGITGFIFDGDADPTPPPAILKGLLPMQGIAFLGGQSGAGKTFIAIDVALALATGEPFFGRQVRERVGVVILAGEGADTLPVRLEAARQARKLPKRLPIAMLGELPNLSNDREVDALIARLVAVDEYMREHHGVRLGLVIIDTVAAAFVLGKGDPNAEAAATIKRMRRIGEGAGALVMPVHHYGKDETTGLLGASGWRAGADAVLSVLADRNQITGEVSNRSLALAKSRVGPEGPIAPFELPFFALGHDDDGELFGSLHVVPRLGEAISTKAARLKREPRHLAALRDAFREAVTEEGEDQRVMGDGPAVRAVRLEACRERFRKRYVTGEVDSRKAKDAVRMAFSRAIALADKAGLASGVWAETEWLWQVRSGGEQSEHA